MFLYSKNRTNREVAQIEAVEERSGPTLFVEEDLPLLHENHGTIPNKVFNLEEIIRYLGDKMRKETENWFKQAKADLKTAGDCLKTDNYYASAFYSQQSLEKALKALFLVERNDTPPKTHISWIFA